MIPILYADGLTATPTASTPVAGRLTDCVSCVVDREVNGIYELTMQYPRDGQFYDQIALRSLIYIQPDRTSPKQLFRIYRISKPLMGVVTINARHVSYDLAGYVRPPFTASGIANALAGITSSTEPSPCPFVFSTSRATASEFKVTVPCDIWSLMAGQAGSLLDVYGGEYDFDNFGITLENRIGTATAVSIEYAKNLTQLLQDENVGEMITGIYPYYYNEDTGLVTLTEGVVDGATVWPFNIYRALDMTDKFESAPTEAQLRTAAQAYVANNNIGELKLTLDVDFVPLEQTVEYGSSTRETVALGDTVTIKYTALGINTTARIVASKYNCLKERFDKLTVGSIKTDLATIIQQTAQNSVQSVQPGTPVATKGAVVNHAVEITPSVSNATGYIQGGTISGTPVTVTAAELVSGTKNITANGQGIDVGNYKYVDVAVPGGSVILQVKSVTPTESAQVVSPDNGYDGLEQVEVAAIPSTYVGSGITRRTSSDLTASGDTVSAPAGYYESSASKAVASGSVGTPAASKGAVSNHQVTVTPSVSYNAGYISGGSKSGTGVTVTAAELASGSKNITANANNIDVVGFSSVNVNVPVSPSTPGSVTAPATISNSTQNPATVSSIPQLNYASATATVSVTPNVTTPGYITAGTPGNSDITLTFAANNIRSGDPSVITPGSTAQQVIPAGVTVAEHAVSVAAVSLQTKSVTPSETAQTVTPDNGYNGLGQVNVGAVASDYVGSGVTRRTSSDLMNPSGTPTIMVPAGYYENAAAKSVPEGTEGTPVATKGAVNNHSVPITPSVTNTEGYIYGDNPAGTPVTVTAAELVSGNLAITANGNNIDVTNYATVSVNVSGGKAVQIAQGVNRVNTTSYTAVSGQSITVAKTGTYDVYWSGFRSSTGGTNGSQLYINNTAHGSAQTTFSNHGQSIHLSNVSLTQGQTVTVRARARGNNYYMYVSNLTIIEA